MLLARRERELIGYALVHVMAARETWISDTWRTPARVAELELLSVLPEHCGRGIGGALLDEVDRWLARASIGDVFLGALAGNEAALRLYRGAGSRRLGSTAPASPAVLTAERAPSKGARP